MFHGWRVVAACFVIAAFAWALGLFGVERLPAGGDRRARLADRRGGVGHHAVLPGERARAAHVGRSIDRWGPRPVLSLGAVSMCLGVALIGQVSAPWQLYPCFVLIGIGWSTLSTTGIAATVAPWFERHQGRSMTLAIMGASVGAIAGVPLLLLALGKFGLGTRPDRDGASRPRRAAAADRPRAALSRPGGARPAPRRRCAPLDERGTARSIRAGRRRRATVASCCGAPRPALRSASRCRSASSPIT